MAHEPQWLESLQTATSYADLQRIFSEMTAEVSQSSNPSALVGSIDEAIRRLELEKARDTAEQEQLVEKYDAFKQEQPGALGWLKRKLPFTETRKQELEHRDAVNDRTAETLGDCFVIARAELLKERLLPEDQRRMGHYPNAWRDRLLQNESVDGVREFATVVLELGHELARSKGFVETLRRAIDVFSDAKFSAKEDCSRRDSDVATARAEVKQVENENSEKVALRSTSLKRLAELIHEELSKHDSKFDGMSENADQLAAIEKELKELSECNELRQTALTKLVENLVRFEAIPDRRHELEESIRKLNREFDDSEQHRKRVASELDTLAVKERQLRHAVAESHDNLQRIDRDFLQRARRYSGLLTNLPQLNSLRSFVGMPIGADETSLFEDRVTGEILPSGLAFGHIPTLPGKSSSMLELERRQFAAQQYAGAFQSDLKLLQTARRELIEACHAALKQRCTMLVDDEIAKEIDFKGALSTV